jgi:hypothetical protein
MAKKNKPKPTKLLLTFAKEMRSASHSPRFQIIIAQGMLELLVNTLVEQFCKDAEIIGEDDRSFPYSVKLVILHEKGLIPDNYFKWMNGLRRIRNEAAHEAVFELADLTPKFWTPFRGLKSTLTNVSLDEPKNFVYLCQEIVSGFWNVHVRFFAPIFEPELFQIKNQK